MQTNVFGVERPLRVVAGLLLLSLFFVLEGNLRYLGLIGLVPLLTGIVGFCPLYTLLGRGARK